MPLARDSAASPRASTENDDRLETGMRATEYHTAVEIDHEAKAAAQHPRKATEDVRTGGNRTVGDVTDANVASGEPSTDAYDGASVTGAQRPAAYDGASVTGAQRRAAYDGTTTEQRDDDGGTGSHDDAGEHTDVGAAPSPPDERVDPSATNGAANGPFDANATMEQNPKTDFNATIEQNPKTPVPTLSRAPSMVSTQTPVPTLDRAASVVTETPMPTRAQSVPMSTAPASLPPPKETTSTTSGPTPACPQCESPMAWVEEHLRFYCRSCRMYF